ncbi:MAG: flagellar type III secretion system protein FliR [Clostridia bacterium]|nr:flagellar type III secretion system protein FliR [Clostridia bacterium]
MMSYLAQAEIFFLALVRITSFFITAPFFGIRGVPSLAKLALGFIVTVLLFPLMSAVQLSDAASGAYVLAVIKEALLGLSMGFLATLIISAIQVAGQFMDLHMGLAMSGIFDPQNATNTTVVGRFFYVMALLLFFQLDGHHSLLLALQASFRYLPLGEVVFDGSMVWAVVKLFTAMFALAMRIALPVIAVLLVSDLALCLVARTVPQLNVFILGFPLKAGLGVLTLIVIFPLLFTVFINIFSQMEQDLALLLRGLSP